MKNPLQLINATAPVKNPLTHSRWRCGFLWIALVLASAATLQSTALADADLPHPLYTWGLSPTNNDWNTPANWIPVGVPDTISEGAVFGSSSVTDIAANVVVHSIEFNPGASQYTITGNLTFNSGGVINNSGVVQTFNGTFRFDKPGATAGSLVTFYTTGTVFGKGTSGGSATFINNGSIDFYGGHQHTTASEATIINNGSIKFINEADAGSATITNNGSIDFHGGHQHTTASEATIINNGSIEFDKADAGSATITNNGGTTFGAEGGVIKLVESGTLSSTIINNGGAVFGGKGARLLFYRRGHANSATLIANGGAGPGSGATILLRIGSTGDSARVEVFGNGNLDVSRPDPINDTVGSIEGNGLVFIGSSNLSVGSNNLNTTFAGIISENGGVTEGTGSLTKTGTGTLILSNANAYSGGTLINGGALFIDNTRGSGTGTGAVSAASGTLGGNGTIAGAVTVGTGTGSGAILSPGTSAGDLAILTIQSGLTFNSDGICQVELNSTTVDSDEVVANGVTINGTAQFSVADLGSSTLPVGTVFTVIDNTAATPISGTFNNLADGSTVVVGSNRYQASYSGGDGNDLTLTVVP